MATLQNLGVLKYRDKDGNWKPLPVVLQNSSGGDSGGISTISGNGQPTESTVGQLNQLYRDESTDKLYICTGVEGGYTWAAVVSDTEDAVTYTVQTLTEEQKTQARANIGAGTSNFSGSYNDLNDQPNIPAATVIDTTLSKSGNAADAKAAGDAIGKKIDKAQGVENAGKILGIGNDGNVVPQNKPVQALAGAAAPTIATAGVVGQEYFVIVDNAVTEIYVCTAVANGTYTWDKVEFGAEIDDNSTEPIKVWSAEKCNQLSEEIADCIKSPTTAEVGQIVKIAAVDDAGKPTAWEAVDMPSDVVVVNITSTTDDKGNTTYLSDMTAVEICEQWNQGKVCVAKCPFAFNGINIPAILNLDVAMPYENNSGASVSFDGLVFNNIVEIYIITSISDGSLATEITMSKRPASSGPTYVYLIESDNDPTILNIVPGAGLSIVDLHDLVKQRMDVKLVFEGGVYSLVNDPSSGSNTFALIRFKTVNGIEKAMYSCIDVYTGIGGEGASILLIEDEL